MIKELSVLVGEVSHNYESLNEAIYDILDVKVSIRLVKVLAVSMTKTLFIYECLVNSSVIKIFILDDEFSTEKVVGVKVDRMAAYLNEDMKNIVQNCLQIA